jgi:hypothetical protein
MDGVETFSPASLIADTVLGLAIILGTSVLWDAWRRRRKRLYHVHVVDLLMLVAVVAACGGVYNADRVQFQAEQDSLRAIEDSNDPSAPWYKPVEQRIVLQLGGPSWVRQRGFDGPFRVFDRVIGIETTGDELEHVRRLRSLQVVWIQGAASNRQLRMLEELPNLRALDMNWLEVDDEGVIKVDEDGIWLTENFRLPKLPSLRGLSLETTAFRGEGLENIPAVETLDLTDTEVDDRAMGQLAHLHQLKDLSLFGTKITDDGLRHLSGLENLEHLSLSGVSDHGLRHLARLKQIRSLRIDGAGITDASVPLLKRFTRLQDLAIGDSSISESGRDELRAAVPNCNIW